MRSSRDEDAGERVETLEAFDDIVDTACKLNVRLVLLDRDDMAVVLLAKADVIEGSVSCFEASDDSFLLTETAVLGADPAWCGNRAGARQEKMVANGVSVRKADFGLCLSVGKQL